MNEPFKKTYLFNGILLLVVLGLYLFLSDSDLARGLLQKNYDRRIHAKEFSLPIIGKEPGDSGHLSLTDLKGAPSVVSFWASWCRVCQTDLPHLASINAELAEIGLQPIVAVASYDEDVNVRTSARYKAGGFRFVLDKEGDVAQLWKVRSLPHTMVLDAEGVVRHSVSGALTELTVSEIRTKLRELKGTAPVL